MPVHTRHQATPVKIPKPPAYRKSSNTDETLEVVTYNQEPKRNSALSNSTYINCPVSLSPSGVTGGDNSARQRNLVKSQISSATSNESIPPALVSFDPKSNTLLRYHQTVASATTYGYTTASRATTSICSDLELVEQPALPTGNQFEGIPVRSAVHNGTNNNSRFNSGNDHMRLRNEQLIATRDRVESVNSYDSGLPGSTGVSQRTSLPPSEGHNLGKIQNLNGVVRAPPPYSNYRELPPASITMNNRLLYGAVRQQQNQEEPHSGSDTFNDNWSTSSYATSNAAQVQTQPPPISRPQIVSGGETSGSKTQNDISNFLAKYYGEDVADGRSEASMYQPYQEK